MKFMVQITSKPLPKSSESSRELEYWGSDTLENHLRRIAVILASSPEKGHLKVEIDRESA